MQHFKFVNWRIGEFVFWCHKQVIYVFTIMNRCNIMVDIVTPSETFSNSGDVSNMDQCIGNSLQCVSIFYQALEFKIIKKVFKRYFDCDQI